MDSLQVQIYQNYFTANQIQGIHVHPHAILRYKQRTGSSKSDKAVEGKLLKALKKSYEVEIKDRFRINALLNNNLVEARYFRHGDWILVVRGNELITIHQGTAGRWGREPKQDQPTLQFEEKELLAESESRSETETSEISEDLFPNPANSHGEWGKYSLFSCCVENETEKIAVVKIKKAKRSGEKYFSKENPVCYVALSEVTGQNPRTSVPDWNIGKITKIENGILFLENIKTQTQEAL